MNPRVAKQLVDANTADIRHQLTSIEAEFEQLDNGGYLDPTYIAQKIWAIKTSLDTITSLAGYHAPNEGAEP